jgi:hypothetical protein
VTRVPALLALAVAAVAPAACRHAIQPVIPKGAAGTAMLGQWEYLAPKRAQAGAVLTAGLQVTLEIDSAKGSAFQGHVARWFAGDLGALPGTFGPVTGTVGEAGAVSVTISYANTEMPPIALAGTLSGDTLVIPHPATADAGPFRALAGAAFVRIRR